MARTYAKSFLSGLYRTVYTIRRFETEGIKLYRQGFIRGYFHPYLGEEAIATGVCAALDSEKDYIASTHRGHGHCVAWGGGLKPMVAELLGKKTGYCKGLGGSMHIADITKHNLGANAIVGASIPLATGAALGISIRGEDAVVVAFTTDGASNNGSFAEGLNLSSAWKLPLIVVIENNQYAVDTPIEKSSGITELYKRGQGYGVESKRVDGNDVLDVYKASASAVASCRKGKGPRLIEAVTYRHAGHHVNDPGTYMPADKMEYYRRRDPLDRARKYAMELGGASRDEIARIETNVDEELAAAIEFAKESPEMSAEEFRSFAASY
jgi:TPP-dependent pyruvate/acetoin dehydrogenase alpha subunit